MTGLGRKQDDWFDRHGGTYVRAKQAAKMPMEKVFPKRRGVEMSTSDGHVPQSFFFMIAGR